MIERLKDMEQASSGGDRPTTAMVFGDRDRDDPRGLATVPNQLQNRVVFDEEGEILEEEKESLFECPTCKQEFPKAEEAKHLVLCFRNSS